MVRVRFSEEAKEMFDFLKEQSKKSRKESMILDSLKTKLELIMHNPHYGKPIQKRQIPKYYKLKYSANNLFRVELPQFWRMLYTLTNNEAEVEIIAFVLDVCDHKHYDNKFGYRNK